MIKEWMEKNNIDIDTEFKLEGFDRIYRVHKCEDSNFIVQEKKDNTKWVCSKVPVNKFENRKPKIVPWKPSRHMEYYAPIISSTRRTVIQRTYFDEEIDEYFYKNGLICRTKQEAEDKLNKIIAFCKKEFGIC